jgi:hypothetical protein
LSITKSFKKYPNLYRTLKKETYNVSARTVLQGTVEVGIVRDGLP